MNSDWKIIEQLMGKLEYEGAIYKVINGIELKLLMIKPEGWLPMDQRPAVIWIHGGGWISGSPEMMLPQCKYFAMRGAVGFSIQYRLKDSKVKLNGQENVVLAQDCLSDCKSAIRFIRKNYRLFGIDPKCIIVGGDSAGAHLAASLSTIMDFEDDNEDFSISSVPNAVISCNAIFDATTRWKGIVSEIIEDDRGHKLDIVEIWKLHYQKAKEISPVFNVRKGQPPVLIIHGLKDTVVEPEQSMRYYEEQLAAGNTAELVLLPEASHAFMLFHYKALPEEAFSVLLIMEQFLKKYGFLERNHL